VTGWDDRLAAWWLGEVASDPAYRDEVLPLALEMLNPEKYRLYLDLGCGDGRLLEAVAAAGARAVGVEGSETLAATARNAGPVAVGRFPDLGFVGDSSVDGVAIVLVLEHLEEIGQVLAEVARVTQPGGVLAVVVNHPLLTAPGSGPFVDPDDGEVLWRWGDYLRPGTTDEPAGPGSVRFHHHPLGAVLTGAAAAGWSLEALVERAVGPERAAGDPLLAVQAEVPRLLGARWVNRKEHATC
jgi:SAM-dependent methyltransferase